MAQPLADYPIQPRLSVQPARHAAAMAPTPMEEFRKQQRARRRGDGGVARRAAGEPVVYRPPERPTSRRRPVTCRTESRPLRYAERGAEPRHVPKDACENEAVRPRRRDGHERRDAHGTAAPRRRTRRRKRDVFHEVDEFSDAAPAPDERAARAARAAQGLRHDDAPRDAHTVHSRAAPHRSLAEHREPRRHSRPAPASMAGDTRVAPRSGGASAASGSDARRAARVERLRERPVRTSRPERPRSAGSVRRGEGAALGVGAASAAGGLAASSATSAQLLGDPYEPSSVAGDTFEDAQSMDDASDGGSDDVARAARDAPRSSQRRKLAPPPQGEVNTVKQGRRFAMNGIDNLMLMMENDTYTTACFSIYQFASKLDYRTVREFFEVLVQLYPKYRYVVDFSPYTSSQRDRKKREEHSEIMSLSPEEQQRLQEAKEAADRSGVHPQYSGPRTTISHSLKTGSLLRPAQWRIDDDFHVSENIEVITCGEHGTEEQLFKIAGRFLARHFNYHKPVWEALLVQGLDTPKGTRSALMIKIHHCFSDGQGMIQSYHAALTAMSKDMGIREVQQWVDIGKKRAADKRTSRRTQRSFTKTIAHTFYTGKQLYLRKRKSFVYRNPKAARASGRLYCHSDGVSMAAIKLIREAFKTDDVIYTLNDVVVTILNRAMCVTANRMYSGNDDRRMALFVPISLRPEGNWDLDNFTTGSLAWFPFPEIGETPIEDQLYAVHYEMSRVKSSQIPHIGFKTLKWYCRARGLYMPNFPVARSIFERAFTEYHVATNVPGPSEPVYFGRHKAIAYHVLPPSSPGKATMAIGMISYANDFSVAISCDDVPEFASLPQALCQAFCDSAQVMIDAARRRISARAGASAPAP